MNPEIVYSEFAVKCECGHIATFKNVGVKKRHEQSCRGCGLLVCLRLHAIVIDLEDQ